MRPDELHFEGQVAIVTGAARGIGRAHALHLAEHGCRLVVNDLGSDARGDEPSPRHADAVVAEIVEAGGSAVPDAHTVATAEGAEAIVRTALDAYGQVDILINNAGTSRSSWDTTIDVHLAGAFHTSRAAWEHLCERRGTILNTTSAAGLFGLARPEGDPLSFYAYAAAKMGVVGLTRSLALEGRSCGVRVNAIAPVAFSRLTAENTDARAVRWLERYLRPEHVAVVAAALVHTGCEVTGRTFSVGGGRVAEVVVAETEGLYRHDLRPEDVAAWLAAGGDDGWFVPTDTHDEMRAYQRAFETADQDADGATGRRIDDEETRA